MSVRTLIVDDEAQARSRLRKMLAAEDGLEIIGEARDGVEAVEVIGTQRPDLIFLDVQMPGLGGFEVLRALPEGEAAPLVIFATAFDRYALDAFEAHAVGYLLKPINRGKLAAAVERVRRLLASPAEAAGERAGMQALARTSAGVLTHVIGRLRDRFLPIPIEDVCCFQMENGLVRVRTRGAAYRTDYALGDLEARLPQPPFFRAHRSAIVNLRAVAEIAPMFNGAYQLTLADEARSEIQVSERQSKVVRGFLSL